jgi:hypothetical protein
MGRGRRRRRPHLWTGAQSSPPRRVRGAEQIAASYLFLTAGCCQKFLLAVAPLAPARRLLARRAATTRQGRSFRSSHPWTAASRRSAHAEYTPTPRTATAMPMRRLPSSVARRRTNAGTSPTIASANCADARPCRAHAGVPSFSHANQLVAPPTSTAKPAPPRRASATSTDRTRPAIAARIGSTNEELSPRLAPGYNPSSVSLTAGQPYFAPVAKTTPGHTGTAFSGRDSRDALHG